jgi:CRP-like cAMP-binding protein
MAPAVLSTRSLVTKLVNYGPLSTDEETALEQASASVREFAAGDDMVQEGSSPDHSTLLLSGFAARYNLMLNGKRQITSLHVTGDFVDLHSLLMRPMDHSILALTTCTTASFPHDRLISIQERFPNLARLLWLNTLVDGGTHRRWTVCVGSLQGHRHLAHLICEMYLRLKQIDRTDGWSFHIPLTQSLLSEALAMSSVHANRVVQALRRSKLIRWERDLITILEWDRLVNMAEFDPTYLRMPKDVVLA